MGLVWVLGFSSIIADGVLLVKHLNLNPNTNRTAMTSHVVFTSEQNCVRGFHQQRAIIFIQELD